MEEKTVTESEVAKTAEPEKTGRGEAARQGVTGELQHSARPPRPYLTRREFLFGVLSVAAAEVLVACRASDVAGSEVATAVPLQILQSPVPLATAEPLPTAAPGELGLEEFLMLSALLTGVSELNPVVGRVYLQSLQNATDFELSLPELYEEAGFGSGAPPESMATLETNGFFDNESTRALADTIIEQWYTGVYQQDGEAAVATFVDNLTWRAIGYTKPPTICDTPGRWAEQPFMEVGRHAE